MAGALHTASRYPSGPGLLPSHSWKMSSVATLKRSDPSLLKTTRPPGDGFTLSEPVPTAISGLPSPLRSPMAGDDSMAPGVDDPAGTTGFDQSSPPSRPLRTWRLPFRSPTAMSLTPSPFTSATAGDDRAMVPSGESPWVHRAAGEVGAALAGGGAVTMSEAAAIAATAATGVQRRMRRERRKFKMAPSMWDPIGGIRNIGDFAVALGEVAAPARLLGLPSFLAGRTITWWPGWVHSTGVGVFAGRSGIDRQDVR